MDSVLTVIPAERDRGCTVRRRQRGGQGSFPGEEGQRDRDLQPGREEEIAGGARCEQQRV